MEFSKGMFFGLISPCVVFLILSGILDLQPAQVSYQEVHRGEVKCIDTPDSKVYCYETSLKGD